MGPYCALYDKTKPIGPHYNNLKLNYTVNWKSSRSFHWVSGANLWLERFYNSDANYTTIRKSFIPFLGLENSEGIGVRLGLGLGNPQQTNLFMNNFSSDEIVFLPNMRAKLGFSNYATLQLHIFDADMTGMSTNFIGGKLNIEATRFISPKFSACSIGLDVLLFPKQLYPNSFIQADLKFSNFFIKPAIGYIKGLPQPINGSLGVKYDF